MRRHRGLRAPLQGQIVLTEDDATIFRLLGEYRYLATDFIQAALPHRNRIRLDWRLRKLFDGFYLDQPKQQLRYVNHNFRPNIHALGIKAPKTEQIVTFGQSSGHFVHTVMEAQVLFSLKEFSPNRFAPWHEILLKAPQQTRDHPAPFRIPLPIPRNIGGKTTHLSPDNMFRLQYPNGEYRSFMLEIDMGTEPLKKIKRKFEDYLAIYDTHLYTTRFNLPSLLVLFVTTSEARKENMMNLLRTIKPTANHFLFKTFQGLDDPWLAPKPNPQLPTQPWATLNGTFDITKI